MATIYGGGAKAVRRGGPDLFEEEGQLSEQTEDTVIGGGGLLGGGGVKLAVRSCLPSSSQHLLG